MCNLSVLKRTQGSKPTFDLNQTISPLYLSWIPARLLYAAGVLALWYMKKLYGNSR
jgi:hypothetical protein